jgi:alanine-synthesizing transaminase
MRVLVYSSCMATARQTIAMQPELSARLPVDLRPNPLAVQLAALRAAGAPLLDLTQSNPTQAGFAYPASLAAALASVSGAAYDPSPFGLRTARVAVAKDALRRGVSIDEDRIVLSASTSEAYSLLFKLLCNPGDEVLVPRPSYPLFEHLTRLESVTAVPYYLDYHGRWTIDPEALERRVSSRTKAILAVSPNNPTGSILTPHERHAIVAVCRRHGMALICDEVFADYLLDQRSMAPVGVDQETDVLIFSLGGLSKTVGLPQLKLAWTLVHGNDVIVEKVMAALELIADTYLSVATPVQLALPALLSEGAAVRQQIQARIAENVATLRALAARHPACDVLDIEGGWTAMLRVPAIVPEEQLVMTLLERDHVIVHPGYFYDVPQEAHLALSLLAPLPTFRDGLRALLARVTDL